MYPPMTRYLRLLPKALCALLTISIAPTCVDAQTMPPDVVKAELRPGWRTDQGTQIAALHLTLAPGWKTYWRSPGDAGIPPEFDWRASEGVSDVSYFWPRPQVFDLNGMRTIAYKNELVLPIEFKLAAPDGVAHVVGKIDIGVCDEICVPVSLKVVADLTAGARNDPLIRAALDDLPGKASDAGVGKPRCKTEPTRDGLRLTTSISYKAARTGDFAVIELPERPVWTSPVETTAGGGQLVQVTDMVPADASPFVLNRAGIRTTIFMVSGDVIEVMGCTG
jgi:DsbC/DsbD-like thiol-disulfide interchange protein